MASWIGLTLCNHSQCHIAMPGIEEVNKEVAIHGKNKGRLNCHFSL